MVIKYTKSHHPNLCIKVGNTLLSLPCWWVILIFFCNHTWQGQLVMFSLKHFLLKKSLPPLFMDGVQLLIFNTRSLGLPGVDLRGKNGWDDLGATQLFSTQDPWIGNPAPWPLGYCSFRLTHLLFKYEQTLFNFSNIQLEQQINFLHNFSFTQLYEMSFLFSNN